MNTKSSCPNKKLVNIRIVGITDGDPFDKRTWSGSSFAFFNALRKLGYLRAGVSGLPSQLIRRFYQVKNFSPSLSAWKFKYHTDVACYRAFTQKVKRELSKLNGDYSHSLQIYSYYDVPSIIRDKVIVKCAYQDGNLARLIDSPRGYPKISSKRIERTLQWERNVFGGLDYIFTFSEWLRQSFINDYNVDPNRVFVVGGGANIPIPEINIKQEFDGRTILFIGIDFERKGGKILLEAFLRVKAEIHDARLLIIGPTLGTLPDGVRCLGHITKNSSKGLMRFRQAYLDASLLVMPSLYEPFGVVFLEAMAHGLPCIGSDNCAIPEIIEHKKTGYLVPVGDSEKLAEKIIELLKSPDLMKKMGDRGYHRVVDNFTWDSVANRMMQILKANM